MQRLTDWPWTIALALLLTGCGKSMHFRTVDAHSGQPVGGVSVERKHTKHYGSLRIAGETTTETLGPTRNDGETIVSGVTGDDAIVFDKAGYWPAVVHIDFHAAHIVSQPHDEELKKTGLPDLDAIRAVKARIHKQLGINEGGKDAKKDHGVILVPLYPVREN